MFTHYERFNDAMRFLIDRFIGLSAIVFRFTLLIRMKTYYFRQAGLRWKFSIGENTPIHGYDDFTRASIEGRHRKLASAAYCYTSGSTKEPKKILYNPARLLKTRLLFVSTIFQYLAQLTRNRSLFIFSPLKSDDSLTILLLKEKQLPPYLCGLQAPHRVQNDRTLRLVAEIYGETAVRLWILVISNPGMIYATNPSTIATFFQELHENWDVHRRLILDYMNADAELLGLHRIHKRIASRGAFERLQKIVESSQPLAISEWIPGLHGFCCWDGGYVGTFLNQIRAHLPGSKYKHWPMFSMSTETVETIGGLLKDEPFFLPLAPGVLYEFIEEGKSDETFHLIPPRDLVAGQHYSMIVSDAYGLERYQTEDLFECVGFVHEIPDLRFIRRRNLSYSFTGEKLTAEQLKLAYQEAVSRYPNLKDAIFLTCFPSMRSGQSRPIYRMIFVATNGKYSPDFPAVTSFIEEKLCEFNPEFKAKIVSGRLGRMEFESISLHEFVRRLNVNSQFKFLPLYPRLWEMFVVRRLHEARIA